MEIVTEKKALNYTEVKNFISEWLKNYATKANQKGFVIGVSGGIDSAVCSALCALTGLPVIAFEMPIHQIADQATKAKKHIDWLKINFPNVTSHSTDLTSLYDTFVQTLDQATDFKNYSSDARFLSLANTRSRLRMITLYAMASANKSLVCGTGNKVEDFGVGFYTKYGDGGVDISPIGDLMKSEVYALGKELGVIEEILQARPTDGLWDDGRTDEDQIGASYYELEWAMNFVQENWFWETGMENPGFLKYDENELTERQRKVLEIYNSRHNANKHKMDSIPVCSVTELRYK